MQRCLVEGRGDDPLNRATQRQLDSALDGQSRETARLGRTAAVAPLTNALVDGEHRPRRSNEQKTSARTNSVVGERFLDDFRTDSANIAKRDSDDRLACGHRCEEPVPVGA